MTDFVVEYQAKFKSEDTASSQVGPFITVCKDQDAVLNELARIGSCIHWKELQWTVYKREKLWTNVTHMGIV